ncbi:hypothetical protein R1flu_019014 [Riccia fluitans]|uniref:DNL-type domain-containing protein n=1 Tax=Riccia fluitans TaxID=41844 RepID=A0ABD1ZJP9_9MARC
MNQGLLDLPKTFSSDLGDAALARCKRGVTKSRFQGNVPTGVVGFKGISVLSAFCVRSTVYQLSCKNYGGQGAIAVAAHAFSRDTLAVLSGPKNSVSKRGKRWQRSFAVPEEGDHFTPEALSSADSTDNGGEDSVESTSDQSFFQDVSIDLKLPRRRMLVEFTCNVCEERTQRLINPEAYKRGTVFVQCAGCEAYHQLVDNLNLIQEFDFRKENGSTGQ